MIVEEINRVYRTDEGLPTTKSEEEVRSNQPFAIHKQSDAIAPPLSTRGGIDRITGHNKLVRIQIIK